MKKIILWVAGGILFVTGAFFLPGYSGDIWSAVISGSIAAFLYLTVFTAVWVKKINSPAKRKGIVGVMGVLIVGCSIFGLINYEDSVRQRTFLADLRESTESGITRIYVYKPLLETFRVYHTSVPSANMKEIFHARFDSLITEDSLYQYNSGGESVSPKIHIVEISEDRIVLVGESKYIAGKNLDFKNYSGMSGQYQVRGILTPKGIRYEREN